MTGGESSLKTKKQVLDKVKECLHPFYNEHQCIDGNTFKTIAKTVVEGCAAQLVKKGPGVPVEAVMAAVGRELLDLPGVTGVKEHNALAQELANTKVSVAGEPTVNDTENKHEKKVKAKLDDATCPHTASWLNAASFTKFKQQFLSTASASTTTATSSTANDKKRSRDDEDEEGGVDDASSSPPAGVTLVIRGLGAAVDTQAAHAAQQLTGKLAATLSLPIEQIVCPVWWNQSNSTKGPSHYFPGTSVVRVPSTYDHTSVSQNATFGSADWVASVNRAVTIVFGDKVVVERCRNTSSNKKRRSRLMKLLGIPSLDTSFADEVAAVLKEAQAEVEAALKEKQQQQQQQQQQQKPVVAAPAQAAQQQQMMMMGGAPQGMNPMMNPMFFPQQQQQAQQFFGNQGNVLPTPVMGAAQPQQQQQPPQGGGLLAPPPGILPSF